MNADLDMRDILQGEPPGQRCSAIRWLQKKVMAAARRLPYEFSSRAEWETFKAQMRRDLRRTIGVPEFPPLRDSGVRARIRVGDAALCERVDVYVDEDYAIPAFGSRPPSPGRGAAPRSCGIPAGRRRSGIRPATNWGSAWRSKGFTVLIFDHAPFGETSLIQAAPSHGMTVVMGMGHVLGISQLALRGETMRCGEYLTIVAGRGSGAGGGGRPVSGRERTPGCPQPWTTASARRADLLGIHLCSALCGDGELPLQRGRVAGPLRDPEGVRHPTPACRDRAAPAARSGKSRR